MSELKIRGLQEITGWVGEARRAFRQEEVTVWRRQ